MIVSRIVSDLLASNMYVITEGSYAIVIDPCRKSIVPKDVKPELILLTHEHYDHISGVNEWKNKYHIPVICSRECDERMQSPKTNMSRYFEAFCGLQSGLGNTSVHDYDPEFSCRADKTFDSDTDFLWRGHTIKAMLVPGHSIGSSAYMIDNCLFSGDVIFEHEDTIVKFPGGSEEAWKEISLPKLRALPQDVVVYPGHKHSFIINEWKPYKEGTDGIFY